MRRKIFAVLGAVCVVGLCAAVIHGQAGQGGGRGGAAAAVPDLPTDKTAFWANDDIQSRWKENESLKRNNSRLFNGPTNISANVRIVLDGDPPATHETTADLWIVTAGTAIARTDGQIVEAGGTSSIRNGMQRTVRPGDILYVPPGVPHHFTDMKGYRAWLIRFDTLGLVRTKPAPQGRGAAPEAGRGASSRSRRTRRGSSAAGSGFADRQDHVLVEQRPAGVVEGQRSQQALQRAPVQRSGEHQRQRPNRPAQRPAGDACGHCRSLAGDRRNGSSANGRRDRRGEWHQIDP